MSLEIRKNGPSFKSRPTANFNIQIFKHFRVLHKMAIEIMTYF
jgi:hypothetical protein